MDNRDFDLTKTEEEYLRLVCGLAAGIAEGTDFGKKQEDLYAKLNRELQQPSPLPLFLTEQEKNLASLAIMVYELLSREKYDVLKEHIHAEINRVPSEQIRTEGAAVAEYVREHDLDLKALRKKLDRKKKMPARKLYIADLHFYHDNLNRRMDMRGFSGYEEMNAHMISRWNEYVTRKDEVYILGDFSISRGRATNEILRQLNGKKYLIEGNHDKYLKDKEFDRSLFGWIRPYAEIRDAGRKVILSHYPVFCYNGQYRTTPEGAPITYMLYGHVHNTHDERLVNEFIRMTENTMVTSKGRTQEHPIPCNMINCFCMFSDYVPLTLNDWIRSDADRRKKMETQNPAAHGGTKRR